MSPHNPPLKFLMPGWFAVVMGLSGLALAWGRAMPLMGPAAGTAAMGLGLLAGLVFVLLSIFSLLRLQRHPQALAEDLKHPVRHAFIATVPISLLLLATVAHALTGTTVLARSLWWLGSLSQYAVTVWVLARWLKGKHEAGMAWPAITPALFIPIVGNVVPPLAGVSLGYAEWSAAQFGIGLLFWPVVVTLLAVRLGLHGLWPDRLLPTTFITLAPPSVIGLAALQLGAPLAVGWMCWGIALFFLAWSASVFKRMVAQPFAITFWALSFPLAALAALTLRLSESAAPGFSVVAMVSLALASIVIVGLTVATLRGLRDGNLLAPEPVATIMPISAATAGQDPVL